MGYHRAGFDVVGVDINPQPHYPFEFHQADALEYLLEHGYKFDAIHASPPCQGYLNLAKLNASMGRVSGHQRMIAETRRLLVPSRLPYVIENVQDARCELREPVRICGTGLNLPIRRHRLFESNISLEGVMCAHGRYLERKYWTSWQPNGERRLSTVVQVYGNGGGKSEWPEAMGIDWMSWRELAEAIPPAYTEFIGRQLIEALP